jgi:antitoxin component of MazEF toxin-antitoxin module
MTEKSYKIFESNGQMKITLPRVLAQSIGIEIGDSITYVIDRGELIIRKVKGS